MGKKPSFTFKLPNGYADKLKTFPSEPMEAQIVTTDLNGNVMSVEPIVITGFSNDPVAKKIPDAYSNKFEVLLINDEEDSSKLSSPI